MGQGREAIRQEFKVEQRTQCKVKFPRDDPAGRVGGKGNRVVLESFPHTIGR